MVRDMVRSACVALALIFLPFVATAADKKAEGELRWGLNYCSKVMQAVEGIQSRKDSPDRIANELAKLEPDHQKYKDYLAKATAIDASVTGSTTVYDKKNNLSFAQVFERCQAIDGEIAALNKGLGQATAERAAEKEKAETSATSERVREKALDEARSAIDVECAVFKKWAGSSGLDDRIASYEQHKKAALATLPKIADEKYTATTITSADDEGTQVTKTVGEWFAYCDKAMPEHLAMLREKEKTAAAAENADADRRRAMNDRIRAEQEAKFNALVASSGGDRKRILQSKGYLPNWPRSGDLKEAPVWKWEINITHEPVRCETFQFSGDKLGTNSTALGGCP